MNSQQRACCTTKILFQPNRVPKRVKDWLWTWQELRPLRGNPVNDRATCKPLKTLVPLVRAQGELGDMPL